jgi:hypothetical protein
MSESAMVRLSIAVVVAALLFAALLFASPAVAGAPVITAAGDIGHEGEPDAPQRRTARLVLSIEPTAALTLGDNQYPDGELADFMASYDPTWGRFKNITRPVPGNHDYHTARHLRDLGVGTPNRPTPNRMHDYVGSVRLSVLRFFVLPSGKERSEQAEAPTTVGTKQAVAVSTGASASNLSHPSKGAVPSEVSSPIDASASAD